MLSNHSTKYNKSSVSTDKENYAEIVNQIDSLKQHYHHQPTSNLFSNITNTLQSTVTSTQSNLQIHNNPPNSNPNLLSSYSYSSNPTSHTNNNSNLSQYQKYKRSHNISQKSLPMNNIPNESSDMSLTHTTHNTTSNSTASSSCYSSITTGLNTSTQANGPVGGNNSNYTSITHSRTEDNLREIAKKLNAEQVKRNLNCELPDDLGEVFQDLQLQQAQTKRNSQVGMVLGIGSRVNFFSNVVSLGCGVKVGVDEDGSIGRDGGRAVKGGIKERGENTGKVSAKKYIFRDEENKNLIKLLSNNIIEYVRRKESLAKHNIPANLRAKMVDWMVEVLSSYKCSEQTFFLAVRIMDLYFQKTTKINEVSDLHLVGVTSMFMACKYQEIYPIQLAVVHDQIAHQKLSIEQIQIQQSEILHAIQFNIIGTTPYEITSHLLVRCNLKEILEPKVYAYLEKICIYLAQMILYDYNLIHQKEYSLLGGSLIYVAYQIIEQIDASFVAVEKIMKFLTIANDPLIETAALILNLAKSFDQVYPNLENLKQFNVFSLEDADKQQEQQKLQQQQV